MRFGMRGIRLLTGACVLAVAAGAAPADAAPTYKFSARTTLQGVLLPVTLAEGSWDVDAANRVARFEVEVDNVDLAETRFSAEWTSAQVPVAKDGTAFVLRDDATYDRLTPGNSNAAVSIEFRLRNSAWYPLGTSRLVMPSGMLVTMRYGGSGILRFPRELAGWPVQFRTRLEGTFTGTDQVAYRASFSVGGAR